MFGLPTAPSSTPLPKTLTHLPSTSTGLSARPSNLPSPPIVSGQIPFPIPVPVPASSASTAPQGPTASQVGTMEMLSRGWKSPTPGTESDASASSETARRCFCGQVAEHGGIYCSIDAFSSLCYKPTMARHTEPSTYRPFDASLSSAGPSAAPMQLSRSDNTNSALHVGINTLSSALNPSSTSEWDASSHYRRLARADLRREERREERKRRRAAGSVASASSRCTTLSTASASSSASRVPDLVGGFTHSRNGSTASTASTAFSDWNVYASSHGAGVGGSGTLSRNASNASSMSAGRRYRGDTVEVIQEDEDEEHQYAMRGIAARPYPSIRNGHVRRPSTSASASGPGAKKRIADPLGMGKDMRDILEEIISMEKSFSVDDDADAELDDEEEAMEELDIDNDVGTSVVSPRPARSRGHGRSRSHTPAGATQAQGQGQAKGLFTAIFDRPPRTPSPAPLPDRARRAPDAPGAPLRGHRNSMSVGHLLAPDTAGAYGRAGLQGGAKLQRPPSFLGGGHNMYGATRGHQSSLSESHTALYLATASPEAPAPASGHPGHQAGAGVGAAEGAGSGTGEGRTPALSPIMRIKSRNSLTFTPDSAGPALPVPDNMADLSMPMPMPAPPFAAFVHHPSGSSWGSGGSVNTTPSRRRPAPSPAANYGALGGWRFPSSTNLAAAASSSASSCDTYSQSHFQHHAQVTPRGPSLPTSTSARIAIATGASASSPLGSGPGRSVSAPLGAAHQASRSLRSRNTDTDRDSGMSFDSPRSDVASETRTHPAVRLQYAKEDEGRAAPHLLWPPPRHLEPSLFPTSPAGVGGCESPIGTATGSNVSVLHSGYHQDQYQQHRRSGSAERVKSPPRSGLRLNVLLGSGGSGSSRASSTTSSTSGAGSYGPHSGMDVDMDIDDGHSQGYGGQAQRGYEMGHSQGLHQDQDRVPFSAPAHMSGFSFGRPGQAQEAWTGPEEGLAYLQA